MRIHERSVGNDPLGLTTVKIHPRGVASRFHFVSFAATLRSEQILRNDYECSIVLIEFW